MFFTALIFCQSGTRTCNRTKIKQNGICRQNSVIFEKVRKVLHSVWIVIYFQNSYVSLFYKDISYIDVLVSDDKAFNAFLSWTEERGIVVSRISVNTNNEIILHVSDWALSDNLALLEGSAPKRGEFVSDIITQEMNQSGIMKRLLPNYNVKIYSLYEPKQFGAVN